MTHCDIIPLSMDSISLIGVGGQAIFAVQEWVVVRDKGASPKLRAFAEDCGYAGAKDELVSFLHSHRFEELLDIADIDYTKALIALKAEKHPDCLCESCTHTETVEYTLNLGNPNYSIARTVRNARSVRAGVVRKEDGRRGEILYAPQES